MAVLQLNAKTDAILRRLVRKEATPQVRKVIARTRPEDLAAAFVHLTRAERQRIFPYIEDREAAAEVLTSLEDEVLRDVVEILSEEDLVDLLVRMEPDDAADVIDELPDDVREHTLRALHGENTEEVAVLLHWPSDTAGGIMSPAVFTMPLDSTCGQTIRAVQERSGDYESVFYVYVVDDQGRLSGVLSLRNLIVHPANTPLVSIMTHDVISVSPGQDQEEVAAYVARYDLLAVPVIDEGARLLGIITVDDVLDVIHEEAVEDMMMMAGVSDDPIGSGYSVWQQARARAGWLLATIFGGIAAAELIGHYEGTLTKVAVLAGFIPVIMGMGGNVGIQSATIAVRGLAVGHVQIGGAVDFILREARVGILLGLVYGTLLGGYGVLRYIDQPAVGISVGISVSLAIVLASLFGSATPVVLARAGVDPAIATGPFVTTVVDIMGIIVYFTVAEQLLTL